MKLADTIDQFLSSVSEKSVNIYKTKINIFHKFLTDEKEIGDKSFESYLTSMRISEIEESLDYYIKINNLTKTSVAWHYISVIKRYFNFLYNNGIQNNDLLRSFSLDDSNRKSFKYQIKQFINNDIRLSKTNVKEELSYEEIELLIVECDEQLNELLKNKTDILNYKKYPSKYNDFMYSIIIKILIFTGIKYKVIYTIKLDEIDIIHNSIAINNYTVHLPDNLSDQVKEYIMLRKQINTDKDLLFVKADGSELDKQTSGLTSRLESYIGRADTTGITKFAVIEMIKKGINQSLVQDFTTVGDDIFKYCQEKVNGEKNQYASRYLDSKLRSMKINDIM